MTNDEINRRVAQIMEPMPTDIRFDPVSEEWQPLDFCTDIAAAWRAVEWAAQYQRPGVMKFVLSQGHDGKFEAQFGEVWSSRCFGREEADTAPMAIALAFLAAFGPQDTD